MRNGPFSHSRILSLTHSQGSANGGEAGIRTLDTGFGPYNGLANRRLQPLGHLTARAGTNRIAYYTGTTRSRVSPQVVGQFRIALRTRVQAELGREVQVEKNWEVQAEKHREVQVQRRLEVVDLGLGRTERPLG